MVLVGRSGLVFLCTAGLEDMAVALSPRKCGSFQTTVFPVGFDAESIKHER